MTTISKQFYVNSYASARELRAEVESWLRDYGVGMRPTTNVEETAKEWLERHRPAIPQGWAVSEEYTKSGPADVLTIEIHKP